MAKRTYILPDRTAIQFENTVASGERSKVIGGLIQDWLDEKQRSKTRDLVVEGCREMGEIYSADTNNRKAIDEEIWRAL